MVFASLDKKKADIHIVLTKFGKSANLRTGFELVIEVYHETSSLLCCSRRGSAACRRILSCRYGCRL